MWQIAPRTGHPLALTVHVTWTASSFPVLEVLASFPALPSICSPPASFHHSSLFWGSDPLVPVTWCSPVAVALGNVSQGQAPFGSLDRASLSLSFLCSLSCCFPPLSLTLHPGMLLGEAVVCSPHPSLTLLLPCECDNQQSSQLPYHSVKWECHLLILPQSSRLSVSSC